MTTQEPIEQRIDRIQNGGIIDLHFDLLMDLYEKRQRKSVLETEFLPELEVGNVGVVGVAIYIENRYLPDSGLRVALDQIARLYAETQACSRFAISKSYHDIQKAREDRKIALLITMEGVEPLGTDLNQLRVFYELGVRSIGLTHARSNAAGHGGVFAASGSPRDGLSAFGREVVRECEALGVIVDLAHINPVGIGFDFFEFIYRHWPESRQKELAAKFITPHFIPDLTNHSHAHNFTRRLIERGFSDADIEKILRGNWLRIFKELL